MSFNDFTTIIDKYVLSGGGDLSFTPTVGDPLVDKNIVKKIQYASNYPQIKNIFLYTNGILLDKIGYEQLLKSGI